MMKKTTKYFFIIFLLFFVNGCFIDLIKQENKETLLDDGKHWYVYKIVLKSGEEIIPTQNAKSTMEFDADEDRIFGVGSCNNYFATFALKGKKLTMSNAGSSRRVCYPTEDNRYEFLFVRGLNGTFVVSRNYKEMLLKGSEISYYLRLKADE
uniref:DUF306 domain-containing protein n=1 Tax=uncultured Helicobacter sp. TaxID=175537 RepID=A0A650EMI2_9HELI|nr:hypothetical protein Helico5904_0300 [uncultured Helicobacter sp.]